MNGPVSIMKAPTSSEENPYAPPAEVSSVEGIPKAPKSFGWRIENGQLWVAASSRLPVIDLFSGLIDETMMLREIEVRYRPWLLRWAPLAAALVILLAGYLREGSFSPSTAILIFAGCWIVAVLISLLLPKCTVRFFLTKQTLRIRKRFGFMMHFSLLMFLVGGALTPQGPSWISLIPQAFGIAWITGLVAGFLFHHRLSCQETHENWFHIQGIHRKAIAYMIGIHTEVTPN